VQNSGKLLPLMMFALQAPEKIFVLRSSLRLCTCEVNIFVTTTITPLTEFLRMQFGVDDDRIGSHCKEGDETTYHCHTLDETLSLCHYRLQRGKMYKVQMLDTAVSCMVI